jgi:ADP-ribose pyrophosphatase YjhB (NUDIX family)
MKRDYPEYPIIGVGAVIVSERGVLLVRRATEPLKGEWSVPGGALELGETVRAGVQREAMEETGLTVEVGPVVEILDSIFPDQQGLMQYHYVLLDYLCTPIAGVASARSDVTEVKWVSEEQLSDFALRDSTERVIRKGLVLAKNDSSASATTRTE